MIVRLLGSRGALALVALLFTAAQAGGQITLLDGRFRVSAEWTTATDSGSATAVRLTDQSAYFWFFDPAVPEIFVKVVDACVAPYDRFWVFAAGLTDVGVALEVEDLAAVGSAGAVWTRQSALGHPFAPILDTGAFATCDVVPACGSGSPADVAASPRPDEEIENLTLFLADTTVAREADYSRIASDLAAIRAAYPMLQASFVPGFVTDEMILGFDFATAILVQTGAYSAWSCLNDWYGEESVAVLIPSFFVLRFGGRYRIDRMLPDYAALAGVTSAELNATSYFPVPNLVPTLCGERHGERFDYFFRETDRYWYFSTEPLSPPQLEGTADFGTSGLEWLSRAQECIARDTPGTL